MTKWLLGVLLLHSCLMQAQTKEECNCPTNKKDKGTFYFAGGYNLDWFTKSDIHFIDRTEPAFDFILYDVKAEDRPGLRNMLRQDITIPQYSFRFGYYFNDKHNLGVEINYDHAKYVVINNQKVHITGVFNDHFFDGDTVITAQWLAFEHTNGANFCMVNLIKRIYIIHSNDCRHWLSGILKAGGGFVFPRSDISINGIRRNDTYHVAGYVTGIDAGLRYDFFRNFFLETSGKAVFANYRRILLDGDGRASQKFAAFEYIFTGGFQF